METRPICRRVALGLGASLSPVRYPSSCPVYPPCTVNEARTHWIRFFYRGGDWHADYQRGLQCPANMGAFAGEPAPRHAGADTNFQARVFPHTRTNHRDTQAIRPLLACSDLNLPAKRRSSSSMTERDHRSSGWCLRAGLRR